MFETYSWNIGLTSTILESSAPAMPVIDNVVNWSGVELNSYASCSRKRMGIARKHVNFEHAHEGIPIGC